MDSLPEVSGRPGLPACDGYISPSARQTAKHLSVPNRNYAANCVRPICSPWIWQTPPPLTLNADRLNSLGELTDTNEESAENRIRGKRSGRFIIDVKSNNGEQVQIAVSPAQSRRSPRLAAGGKERAADGAGRGSLVQEPPGYEIDGQEQKR